jgi:hypothetical protein
MAFASARRLSLDWTSASAVGMMVEDIGLCNTPFNGSAHRRLRTERV